MQHVKGSLGSPDSPSEKARLKQVVHNSIGLLFRSLPPESENIDGNAYGVGSKVFI